MYVCVWAFKFKSYSHVHVHVPGENTPVIYVHSGAVHAIVTTLCGHCDNGIAYHLNRMYLLDHSKQCALVLVRLY